MMMINEQLGEVDSSDQVMAYSVTKRSCPVFSLPDKWVGSILFHSGLCHPSTYCLEGGKVLAFTGRRTQPVDALGVDK